MQNTTHVLLQIYKVNYKLSETIYSSHKGELRRSIHQPSHRQQGVLSRCPQSVEQSADRTQDSYLFSENFQMPSENMSFSRSYSD